jgi:hypothetical protein
MEHPVGLSQYVIEHILSVLGGAGLVITALSAYLGKLLSNRSLMREKNRLETSLLELKSRHALELSNLGRELKLEILKKDQFHQISKQTFELIFEKKIEIYNSLLNFKVEFLKLTNESHVVEVEDPTPEYHSLFMKCRKIIELNKLYISEALSVSYDAWYIKAAPYLKRANVNGYTVYECSDPEDWSAVWEAQQPAFSEMTENTIDEMKEMLSQIEKDISLLRANIEAPMLLLKT